MLAIRKFVVVHIRLFLDTMAITAKFPNSEMSMSREYANALTHFTGAELFAKWTQLSFKAESRSVWLSVLFKRYMSGTLSFTQALQIRQENKDSKYVY